MTGTELEKYFKHVISTSKVDTNIGRREFLRQMMAMAVVAGGASVLSPKVFAGEYDADVIVLGAGVAGITAARNLSQGFVSDGPKQKPLKVIVLEGSDRIGGRIQTSSEITGHPIELGGEYIHREKNSVPLWDEVKRYQIPTKKIPQKLTGAMYHKDWGSLRNFIWAGIRSPGDVLTTLKIFNGVDDYNGPDMSAAQWIQKEGLDGVARDLASMALTGHLPSPEEDLSVRGFKFDNISEQMLESNEYYVTSGYGSIFQKMAKGLDIRLGQKVQSVHYDGNGVSVSVVDDSGAAKTYRAKSAICTFSVGMLQSQKVTFAPALPMRKQESLKVIKMGPIFKMVLVFNEKFWSDGLSFINRAGPRRGARTYFHVYRKEKNKPAVLNALVHGVDAQRLRYNSDEEVLQAICQDLDEMFEMPPGTSRKKLKTYRRKQWVPEPQGEDDDPFAFGGVSYLSRTEAKVDVTRARDALADPKETPSLFWAGEATSTETQASSVHGAHASGLRAAEQVQEYLRTGNIVYPKPVHRYLERIKRERQKESPETRRRRTARKSFRTIKLRK